MKYLKNFIEECKEKNIRLYFCVSPDYYPISNGAYQPIFDLAREENIPMINSSNDPFFVEKPHLFHDDRHLNEVGAELYSQKIAHLLKQDLQGALSH